MKYKLGYDWDTVKRLPYSTISSRVLQRLD